MDEIVIQFLQIVWYGVVPAIFAITFLFKMLFDE